MKEIKTGDKVRFRTKRGLKKIGVVLGIRDKEYFIKYDGKKTLRHEWAVFLLEQT